MEGLEEKLGYKFKNIDLLNFDCVNMFCNQISFLNYLKLLSI